MRVVFFGTPDFAVPTLRALAASPHVIAGVVTQPDRPRGRGQQVAAGPVKTAAQAMDVPVLQPDALKAPTFLEAFDALDADIGVVAAYGKMLPQVLLDRPPRGLVNVHASLLPRWRGAAPIHRAIIAGDAETGVTIMQVVLALDAGPMLARAAVTIGADETSAALEPRVADIGAALLVETLNRLAAAPLLAEPQDERFVTYAHRLERADSQIDWALPAPTIHNRIRGLQPWPMAVGVLNGQRLRLVSSAVSARTTAPPAEPGTVIGVDAGAIEVATGAGVLEVTRVQPDGRAAMPSRDFLNGRRVTPGDRFAPLPPS